MRAMIDDYWRGKGIPPAAINFTNIVPPGYGQAGYGMPGGPAPQAAPQMPMGFPAAKPAALPEPDSAMGALAVQQASADHEGAAERRRRDILSQLLAGARPGPQEYFSPQQGMQLGMTIGNAFRGGIFGGRLGPSPDYHAQVSGGGMAKGPAE
jgi:hypothetical protein